MSHYMKNEENCPTLQIIKYYLSPILFTTIFIYFIFLVKRIRSYTHTHTHLGLARSGGANMLIYKRTIMMTLYCVSILYYIVQVFDKI